MLSDGQLQDITERNILDWKKYDASSRGSTFFQETIRWSPHDFYINWEVRPYWRRDHIQLMEGGQN